MAVSQLVSNPWYTNLCHTAKSHARVLGHVEHTDLISN
ncbi:hypothetical protein F383_25027 [Gossypium arboreum]|uniref:Uncharacterized protein n=1 Tax=Gossypium arboreum TaxID=29729 RepID=A0A0B0N4W9_GOSAR|nr:hypothetical protein F383_34387 [Gossypium arboreum]KHG19234.1 hypothetical protein F383_25027 [Gossypium arboreum]